MPQFAARCRERHARNPKISVVECAVGNSEAPIILAVGDLVSTADALMAQAFSQIDWAKGRFTGGTIVAPQRRLDAILKEERIAPGLELLVVDVEGWEEDVFASFDLAFWRPQMMIIELVDGHPEFAGFSAIVERDTRLRKTLLAAFYRPVYRDAINTVFWNASVVPAIKRGGSARPVR